MTVVASCRRLDHQPEDGRPRWAVTLDDGRALAWDRFTTGPVVMADAQVDDACRRLLGVDLAGLPALAAAEVRSYVEDPDDPRPAVLLHSATRTTKGFEGDLTDLAEGREPYDVAAYLEARVVSIARPGDLAVGRTMPWREAVNVYGVDHVDIGDLDHYYLSQALVAAALRHAEAPDPALDRLIAFLRANPEAVVRLYALDTDLQLFLTWLRRAAGLDALNVDANSPEVAGRWNQKNHLHPDLATARARVDPAAHRSDGAGPATAAAVLRAESGGSDLERTLGPGITVLPGYRVTRRAAGGPDAFARDAVAAAEGLRDRYGVPACCLKPSEAGDGARIVAPLATDDTAELAEAARRAFAHGDDYLVEAFVEYRRFAAAGRAFIHAPSGHIAGGHVQPGLTAQLMNGRAWEGNAYIDEHTCESIGITGGEYATMRRDLQAVRDAFTSPAAAAAGCRGGLVTGGVDFAIGTVGGAFGDTPLVAATDFNLSSHGAVYLRAFLAHTWASPDTADGYVATWVFRPALDATLSAVRRALAALGGEGLRTAVASVPGRWGMIGASAPDTATAIERVRGCVDALEAQGLAGVAP